MSGFLLLNAPTGSLKPFENKEWRRRGVQLTRYFISHPKQ